MIRLPAAARPLLLLLGMSGALPSANAAECKAVRGAFEETQVTGPACLSPVGLCTVANLFGPLKGQARFTATSFVPSADTPVTGVIFVTGDSAIVDAELAGRRGTLAVKNAAAFRTAGEGDLTDTQVIIGGSGDFTGASGSLRINATFTAGSGSGTLEGTVCVP